MNKSVIVACVLSACAIYSFAQTPTNVAGARLVAERDAAYAKTHANVEVKAATHSAQRAVPRKAHKAHRTTRHATKKVVK